MASIGLSQTPNYTDIFCQRILSNIQYWRDFVANQAIDVAALDSEREGIIRAIIFALELEVLAWSSVRKLIEIFAPYMERRGHWEIWNHVLSRAAQVAVYSGEGAGAVDLSVLLARLSFRQSRFQEMIRH